MTPDERAKVREWLKHHGIGDTCCKTPNIANLLDTCDELEQERDDACKVTIDYQHEIEGLEQERDQMREALRRYGKHKPLCSWFREICNCGLDAALAPRQEGR